MERILEATRFSKIYFNKRKIELVLHCAGGHEWNAMAMGSIGSPNNTKKNRNEPRVIYRSVSDEFGCEKMNEFEITEK